MTDSNRCVTDFHRIEFSDKISFRDRNRRRMTNTYDTVAFDMRDSTERENACV